MENIRLEFIKMINSIITGSGRYLPNRIIKNSHFHDYEFYDENGDKIEKPGHEITQKFEEITEIKERRYVEDDLVNSDIATLQQNKQ